jgi:hypothetical protein
MSYTRFLAGFDLHGDRQDADAVKAFFEFDSIWKPNIRIFGGDLIDLRPLRKGASEAEREEGVKADVEAGKAFLKRWRPNYYLRGNHCERLWETAETGKGLIKEAAKAGCEEFETLCRIHKTHMLPYHKRHGILKLGHLKVLHGFACGVYASRQTALVYGSAIFGHIHCIDEHAIPGLERRVARACGALCQLDLDYNARQPNTLRQAHGWAYGVINEKTGDYHVWTAEKIGDKWLLPTNLKAIG